MTANTGVISGASHVVLCSVCSQHLCANVHGLSVPAIRANYIIQYANSLIGHQLKTLAQVNAFHIYDLVGTNQFAFTKAVAELSALLWMPEIRNLEEYLVSHNGSCW